jgi:oligopeptide/dipeptide ABC transporter ATP-binding protein
MYLGKIVELAPTEVLFQSPKHPYTQTLLTANPIPDPDVEYDTMAVEGDVPSALNPPRGCPFHTRCPMVMEHCKTIEPPWIETGEGREKHTVWCHLYTEETAARKTSERKVIADHLGEEGTPSGV